MIDKAETPEIFNQIASRYDFINHFMSLGIDKYWRNQFVKKIPIRNYNTIIDIASGTGDLLQELKKLNAKNYYALDPSANMLSKVNSKCPEAKCINASAENIPLINDLVDLATISFGIRNFSNPTKALHEIQRILKPKGILAIMEFNNLNDVKFKSSYSFYFNNIVPYIGGKLSGNNNAYKYFKDSVPAFYDEFNFEKELNANGFKIIYSNPCFLRIINVIIAEKQ
jgi:demethylmenaquinone methyltransferase / 2-methoxy-6-polyprenyl-1,4-benzoquinol methylase